MEVEKPVVELFAEVATKYGWEESLTKFMVSTEGLGATSMRDFTFLTEADLPKLIEKVQEVKNTMQQTSRLRQAWAGMKTAELDRDQLKRKRADDVDLDELLRQEDLDDLADVFHARYHMKWPNDTINAFRCDSKSYLEGVEQALAHYKGRMEGEVTDPPTEGEHEENQASGRA